MSLGPFDLPGGAFLTLYIVLLIGTVVAGFIIPRWLRPEGRAARVTDPEKLAFLGGGASRFVDAVISRLLAGDALMLVGKQSVTAAPGAAGRTQAEQRVLAIATGTPVAWQSAARTLTLSVAAIDRELVSDGFLMEQGLTNQLRFWQTSPYLLLFVFGAIKVGVGEARDRPVGFLVGLLMLTGLAAAVRFFIVDRRTRGAMDALATARAQGDRLRRAPAGDVETGLAVALFGTVVLAGSPWSGYHSMRMATGGDGGSGGDGGGGGCGGGGGGGGCGGCGS